MDCRKLVPGSRQECLQEGLSTSRDGPDAIQVSGEGAAIPAEILSYLGEGSAKLLSLEPDSVGQGLRRRCRVVP